MRLLFSVIILLAFSTLPLSSEEDNRIFYILKNREGAGLFSMFGDVLALLHSYDNQAFRGIEIDFGTEGQYYEVEHGPNWWNYYCEPIHLGDRINIREGTHGKYGNCSPVFFYRDREEAFHVIQKHIHFLPHIMKKVEEYKQTYFQDYYVIGVHYRGTDAPESSPSYEIYANEIHKVINTLENADFKIFIASDEQPFIDFMKDVFPDRICCQSNVLRSSRGGPSLHMSNSYSRYSQGEEAIVDCLLLSNCSLMMLTYSNLSLWASLLNPYIPMIDVSRRLPIVH